MVVVVGLQLQWRLVAQEAEGRVRQRCQERVLLSLVDYLLGECQS